MLRNVSPRTYNIIALTLTCATGSTAAAIVSTFASANYAFIVASMIGYGFGRFLMPLR